MNKHIVKGKLKEMKGAIKDRFGKAGNKPMTQLGGKKDKLIGNVQKEYGKAKDEAREEREKREERDRTR